MVGDGSYLMMNSEIATSVMLGLRLTIVVLDNRGYGCINRLQRACGSENYNNLLQHCIAEGGLDIPVDFAAHAASLGARSVHCASVEQLKAEMVRARRGDRTTVLVIDTTPERTTPDGGTWWEVGIPEVSPAQAVRQAHEAGLQAKARQRQ